MTYQQDRDAAARLLSAHYPCTLLLLEDRAQEAIELFCSAQMTPASSDAALEVHRWRIFLRSGIARRFNLAPYFEDVAAYEEAVAALASSGDARRDADKFAERNAILPAVSPEVFAAWVPEIGKHVRIEHFDYDAPAIVAAIENCDRIEPVERPAPRTVLLVKAAGQDRPRLLLINSHLHELMATCDGQRDCAAVARAMGAGGDPTLKRKIFDAIEALREKNALTLSEPRPQGYK